jgi:hypothetical protein
VWFEGDAPHELPRWAVRFAVRVDAAKAGEDGRCAAITAAECLAVLDEVTQGSK